MNKLTLIRTAPKPQLEELLHLITVEFRNFEDWPNKSKTGTHKSISSMDLTGFYRLDMVDKVGDPISIETFLKTGKTSNGSLRWNTYKDAILKNRYRDKDVVAGEIANFARLGNSFVIVMTRIGVYHHKGKGGPTKHEMEDVYKKLILAGELIF